MLLEELPLVLALHILWSLVGKVALISGSVISQNIRNVWKPSAPPSVAGSLQKTSIFAGRKMLRILTLKERWWFLLGTAKGRGAPSPLCTGVCLREAPWLVGSWDRKTGPLAVSTANSCPSRMVVPLSRLWPFLSLAMNCFPCSEVGRGRERAQNEWLTLPGSDLPRVWVGEFVTFEGAVARGGGCTLLT